LGILFSELVLFSAFLPGWNARYLVDSLEKEGTKGEFFSVLA
jgi:hypothetical protein